ncbi:motile sperm domain-containing protein 1 [Leptinotarsa decemlineata]|uniref:motile sperm domain-containing protein 1 n=1 Tax=Leptinotarsa decemlineata TaxID=7539 RepID=UPI000C253ACD|nr:motile sperm domain-containing protein 1-like [Leptinotarsa decemlineata]
MPENIRIPVFVFPTELKFYLPSKSSHKQVLSIYNPYDFKIKYKVLSTASRKYSVIKPEGNIGPQMLVDVVVRHNFPTEENANITDKFRVVIEDHSTKKVVGNRDIKATLMLKEEEEEEDTAEGDSKSLPGTYKEIMTRKTIEKEISTKSSPSETNVVRYTIIVAVGITCLGILILPTQAEVSQSSKIPDYLHISNNLKYVAAYILGLVTLPILVPRLF